MKGRNEDKVKFAAEHLLRELEKSLGDRKGLTIAGPAPAPLERAETFYRYHIMLRSPAMSVLSRRLAVIVQAMTLPDDVSLAVDIDPVNLG